MNNPQQPREYDAVLGGNSPSLEGAAVLGGIEGVKLRLKNPDTKVRIAALQQVLNYGEQGLDLVIAGLKDESWDVQNTAYLILIDRTEPKVKQALISNLKGLKLEKIEVVTVNKDGEIIQRQPRVARYFIEDLGNGLNLEMAAIPGGTFMMGSPGDEKGRRYNESLRQVTVPSFFMGKYPITKAQYQAIRYNLSEFKDDNHPVTRVSWLDAAYFCEKLSKKTGKNYRLPTETEWEYACRAGTTTAFYFGETITPDLVNYLQGKHGCPTTEVGFFPPNAFGLYDMHGNVWEWCKDGWNKNCKGYGDSSTEIYLMGDVTARSIREFRNSNKRRGGGEPGNLAHIIRGGSYTTDDIKCRSAHYTYQSLFADSSHNSTIGFRVAFISM